MAVVSRWLLDVAFAASPQSGLAWFCFLFPLIEPDRQFSRIRLSEKTHAFAHGKLAVRRVSRSRPNSSYSRSSGYCMPVAAAYVWPLTTDAASAERGHPRLGRPYSLAPDRSSWPSRSSSG